MVETPGAILVDANYFGTKGYHLYFGGAESMDYFGSWIESYTTAQLTALSTYVANPFYGYITDQSSTPSFATVVASYFPAQK
jgi:hypothetical protein